MEKIEDRNLAQIEALVSPREVKRRHPLTSEAAEIVLRTRREVRDLLHGHDRKRLLVIVGPCSIHDREAALEYAERLGKVAAATQGELVVVMRTYFEKPRTTVGWKGLINDPNLDGSCDIATGLELARAILLEVNHLGVPCGSELLDPIVPQYIADLLSWAAVGARTSESQTHRELASGLSMPVGFKNGTDGSLHTAANAMTSARHPHSFLGINADGITSIVKTLGNPDRHIVLRGGSGGPNYSAADIARAFALVSAEGVARPILIDCSHGNSGKDPMQQATISRAVLEQVRSGQEAIVGVMLESNLRAGNQAWVRGEELAYGMSITDACMGWGETEELLYETARAIGRSRRGASIAAARQVSGSPPF